MCKDGFFGQNIRTQQADSFVGFCHIHHNRQCSTAYFGRDIGAHHTTVSHISRECSIAIKVSHMVNSPCVKRTSISPLLD